MGKKICPSIGLKKNSTRQCVGCFAVPNTQSYCAQLFINDWAETVEVVAYMLFILIRRRHLTVSNKKTTVQVTSQKAWCVRKNSRLCNQWDKYVQRSQTEFNKAVC